jgi:hypothetical protein
MNRQMTAMAQSPVTTNFCEPLDIQSNFTP